MEAKTKELRGSKSAENILGGLMDFFVPTTSGISTLEFPEGRIMGIPQRTYGYLTKDIKERYEIEGLQTTDVRSRRFLAGCNKNGCFLAHLDEIGVDESDKMFERLLSELKGNFRLFMSYNKDKDRVVNEEEMTRKLEKLFRKHVLSLEMIPKLSFQELRIGITYEGRLFHPKNFVKNDSAYEEEYGLEYGALTSQIKWRGWRMHLACINDIERKT